MTFLPYTTIEKMEHEVKTNKSLNKRICFGISFESEKKEEKFSSFDVTLHYFETVNYF